MQTRSSIPPRPLDRFYANWLKPRIARAFIRKVTKPKLKATPEQLRALQKKHGKG